MCKSHCGVTEVEMWTVDVCTQFVLFIDIYCQWGKFVGVSGCWLWRASLGKKVQVQFLVPVRLCLMLFLTIAVFTWSLPVFDHVSTHAFCLPFANQGKRVLSCNLLYTSQATKSKPENITYPLW